MFKRPHHQHIARLLAHMDGAFLESCSCFFSGGTAVALMTGECRESRNVDFLCSSQDGYRRIREAIASHSLGKLFRQTVKLHREVRADQYGIRTFIDVDGEVIRFEVIREARMMLTGSMNNDLGVPVLCRIDLFAEKLLANTDRSTDKSTMSRDLIDLAMMTKTWGSIPAEAWAKAEAAYGNSVRLEFDRAIRLLDDATYLAECFSRMHIDLNSCSEIAIN